MPTQLTDLKTTVSQAIEIFTVQMGQWRLAKEQGIKFLDITAKSGVACFAPHFTNVMKYKRGEMGEVEYTELYLKKMEVSRVAYPRHWDTLAVYPRLAVACYCKPGVFCHRHLFVKLAETHLIGKGFEVNQMGELLPIKGIVNE